MFAIRPGVIALLSICLLAACSSRPKDEDRFQKVEQVTFRDARGSRLTEVAVDQEREVLVGQVTSAGAQEPIRPYVEARYYDARGEMVATSHARLRARAGSRAIDPARNASFELPVPAQGFERVELSVVATHPDH